VWIVAFPFSVAAKQQSLFARSKQATSAIFGAFLLSSASLPPAMRHSFPLTFP
jgi:hypothetical protein